MPAENDTYETCLICGEPTGQPSRLCSSKCERQSTNNVFSDAFESKLDPHFRADFDNTYKWAPGARARPRLVELGMLWDQKETKKGRGI